MQGEQTVFIVDDDVAFVRAMERVFRGAGFRVRPYSNAQAFLDDFSACADSCLILDLRMPRLGGLELQERLRARGIDTPIIIYSGNADVPVTVRAMQAGAFDVIEKPSSNELMVERVRAAIASARPRRARQERIADARQRLGTMSEREREIGRYLAEGLSAAQTGALLGISPRTVEAHRNNVYRKLEIKSSAALARLFVLAELGDP